jgi:ubiquinone/menaquinone biosynthesis C-methylase UbiE
MKNNVATRESFWKKRAKNYEKLQWAIKSGYLHAFLEAGEFNNDDAVLDIGSGTGIIAHTVAPHVREVIGIDISEDMLSHAFEHRTRNEKFLNMDVRCLGFSDNYFSKVTARMVFHHVLGDTQKAADECYRVLKKGGRMILSEGVPPHEDVKPFYTEMFKLKEERLTFMEKDIVDLMTKADFKKIQTSIYYSRRSSIKNWLENSGLPKNSQNAIMKMHMNMDKKCKRAYSFTKCGDDCLIDMKFAIVVGEK